MFLTPFCSKKVPLVAMLNVHVILQVRNFDIIDLRQYCYIL
jgi:hypothetical protein